MNKDAVFYTDEELERIEDFIEANFGSGNGFIAHEIESEYVHTDSIMTTDDSNGRNVVTFGMGARQMNSPTDFDRCELVLSASERIEPMSEDALLLSSTLANISKYPFANDTWFQNGHTVGAGSQFKKRFGFDCFAFYDTGLHANLSTRCSDVGFLALVPIYAQEREWIMEHNTLVYMELLYQQVGSDMFNADCDRDLFIPDITEEEEMNLHLMITFGIDNDGLQRLMDYLHQMDEQGVALTEEMIERWLEENR